MTTPVHWPTDRWVRGTRPVLKRSDADAAIHALFDGLASPAVTYALLIAQRGELIYERYDHGASPFYLQYSWSMAKSITQALVGFALVDGLVTLEAPLNLPEWRQDERSTITLQQLLEMRSGLAFNEDYVDGQGSDVIAMLEGTGRADTGAFAAAKPLTHAPGSHFSYSSGTTNIICRTLREAIGGPSDFLRFAAERLFDPIGMRSATPRFDRSGTFIGSSYLFANPRDFLRFGLLYRYGGVWENKQLLPAGWTEAAIRRSYDDGTQAYGAHWWLEPGGARYWASGYDGQRIIIDPESDTVMVRLGRTPEAQAEQVWSATTLLLDSLAEA